jgi:solute carrier family 25 carnitine/acylcarnitine transporter 20/29
VRELVSQHLIPTAPGTTELGRVKAAKNTPPTDGSDPTAPINMEDTTHGTVRSKFSSYGDVVFMHSGNGEYLVGIKGARGTAGQEDWAKVLAWGRSTVSTSLDGHTHVEE